MCPDAGRARLPISPSTSTSGKASSSRLRASALSWLGLRTLSEAGAGMQAGYRAASRALAAGVGSRSGQIGRAHVRTPVTNAHLVCRLLLENKYLAYSQMLATKRKTLQTHL